MACRGQPTRPAHSRGGMRATCPPMPAPSCSPSPGCCRARACGGASAGRGRISRLANVALLAAMARVRTASWLVRARDSRPVPSGLVHPYRAISTAKNQRAATAPSRARHAHGRTAGSAYRPPTPHAIRDRATAADHRSGNARPPPPRRRAARSAAAFDRCRATPRDARPSAPRPPAARRRSPAPLRTSGRQHERQRSTRRSSDKDETLAAVAYIPLSRGLYAMLPFQADHGYPFLLDGFAAHDPLALDGPGGHACARPGHPGTGRAHHAVQPSPVAALRLTLSHAVRRLRAGLRRLGDAAQRRGTPRTADAYPIDPRVQTEVEPWCHALAKQQVCPASK